MTEMRGEGDTQIDEVSKGYHESSIIKMLLLYSSTDSQPKAQY